MKQIISEVENVPQYSSIHERIIEILKQSDLALEAAHAENALSWLLVLNSKASEAQKIAILGHDIERGVPPREKQRENEFYDDYKQRHSARSALIMRRLLEEFKVNPSTIDLISDLVARHEIGGDIVADCIQDADSISYFDIVLPDYLIQRGLPATIKKMKWMYFRCSERAQRYIQTLPLFQQYGTLMAEDNS